MNPIIEFLKSLDSLPWRRSEDGKWTSLETEVWRTWNYGACEDLRKAAQHSVHRVAFPAFCGGVIFGIFIGQILFIVFAVCR